MDEWYEANPVKFQGSKPFVEALEAYRKYFNDILEKGKGYGVKEFQTIPKNRLYMPRMFDFKRLNDSLKNGGVTVKQIYNSIYKALENDYRNVGLTADDLAKAAKDISTNIRRRSQNLDTLQGGYLVSETPLGGNLKGRKLYLNDKYLEPLVISDMDELTSMYNYRMSGRIATQYAFGTDDFDEIMVKLQDDIAKSGYDVTKEEMKALNNSIRDLLGELRINKDGSKMWEVSTNLRAFNTLTLGGSFGLTQFTELMGSLAMTGLKSAFKDGNFFRAFKDTANIMYRGKDGSEFAEYMITSGRLEEALHQTHINRIADANAGVNDGWFSKFQQNLVDKFFRYNGLRYFTATMENMVGGAVVNQLKKGNVPKSRLARWGLTPEEADSLGKALNEHTTFEKMNLDKLTEKQREQLQLAINRGVEEIVIQNDSIHLPGWAKVPEGFRQMLTQFLRFPMIAHNILLRRGLTEEQAVMAGAMITSSVTYMAMLYFREQAAYQLGLTEEKDLKYDYFGDDADEAIKNGFTRSINYMAPLGMGTTVWNYGAIATGNPQIGSEYIDKHAGVSSLAGPSAQLGDDLLELTRKIFAGEYDDERTLTKARRFMYFMNAPLLGDAYNKVIEEVK